MRIKKYLVTDMNEAIRMIREDMGPDAVIISNYRLPRKGMKDFFSPRLIEVTAAIDEQKSTFQASTAKLKDEGEPGVGKLLNLLSSFEKESTDLKPVPETGMVHPSIYEKRVPHDGENFDTILKNKGDLLANREFNQQWKRILTGLEINENIVEKLLSSLGAAYQDEMPGINEMYEAYMILLKSKIAKLLESAYQTLPQHRISAFVGPSGAGKTLSLAKLATHYKMFENKKVAVIAANYNGQRPDLTEKLRYYGSLIGISVESAESQGKLVELVGNHADADMILVDTPGTNSKNSGAMLKLNYLLQPFDGERDTYLVLSSATKSQDLMRTAIDYQQNIEYSKLIFTKMDETETCGAILNVVNKTQVPVSFVAYGQGVPDDITAVNAKKLAGLLLGGVEKFVEQGLQSR